MTAHPDILERKDGLRTPFAGSLLFHVSVFGGLILAFAEQFTVRYAPVPPGLAMGVPLVLLILFLLVRPTGLLLAREARA